MIHLLQVPFKAGRDAPPVQLICQIVDLGPDSELLVWVDCINAEAPVVVPLSSVSGHHHLSDFESYMAAHKDISREVLLAGAGEISPTIAARAVAYMAKTPGVSAADALDTVQEQAIDLIEADHRNQAYFFSALGPTSTLDARTTGRQLSSL